MTHRSASMESSADFGLAYCTFRQERSLPWAGDGEKYRGHSWFMILRESSSRVGTAVECGSWLGVSKVYIKIFVCHFEHSLSRRAVR